MPDLEQTKYPETAPRRGPGTTLLTAVGALCAIAAIVGMCWLYADEARRAPLQPFDEALWLNRSLVPPSDVSSETYHYWAVDIPGMNRWAYYTALKLTGFDRVPAGESEAWSVKDGVCAFRGEPVVWADASRLEEMKAKCGEYAPRRSLMLMRAVNLTVFAGCVAMLWFVAWWVLRSWGLALLAVAPITLTPIIANDIAFMSWSGDVFLLAWLSATLAGWVWFHLRGRGASPLAVLVVSTLAGLAAGSKHPGVLVALAYAAYLAGSARGLRRVTMPIVSLAVAFLAFSVVNPVVMFSGRFEPWEICRQMMSRRAENVASHIAHGGALTYATAMKNMLFWWPIVPVAVYAMWACRRERWFAPLALWGGFLVAGVLAGLFIAGDNMPRYLGPVELAIFYPAALCFLHLARHNAAAAETP